MTSKFDIRWQKSRLHSWWEKISSGLGWLWQKIKKSLVVITIIAFLVGGLVWPILAGYRLAWTGFSTKTLWDWMQLLVVPLMLAVGGFWLNQLQKSRDERAAEQRSRTERENALDKQRQDLLQTYLDCMSELLLKEKLRSSEVDAEVRNVARVRTITVLTQLDARRLSYVFAFLREAGLMSTTANDNIVSLKNADFHAVDWSHADLSSANLRDATLSGAKLSGANLIKANLRDTDLSQANLSETKLISADLSSANLSQANLSGAFLYEANLSKARLGGALPGPGFHKWDPEGTNLSYAALSGANLSGASLSGANLSGAGLNHANLSGANLSQANFWEAFLHKANLSSANLRNATLSGADLSGADLSGAKVTEEQLKEAKSLKDTIMPDRSKHP